MKISAHQESLATTAMTMRQAATSSFLHYVGGVSERIRKVCQDFNIGTVFKSGPTLRNLLTKAKDPLPIDKQWNVVYEVPSTCGKVYIGETKCRLETKIKEHKDACVMCLTDKSAIAKHERLPNKFGRHEGFTRPWTGSEGIAEHTCDTRGHAL